MSCVALSADPAYHSHACYYAKGPTVYLISLQSAPPIVSGVLLSAFMRSHWVVLLLPDRTKA